MAIRVTGAFMGLVPLPVADLASVARVAIWTPSLAHAMLCSMTAFEMTAAASLADFLVLRVLNMVLVC